MSIKTQKILRFIPIVNMITVFVWIGRVFGSAVSFSYFLKHVFKLFFWMIVITVPRIICSFVFGNDILDMILMWVCGYFYFFAMSWVAVSAQEELQKTKDTEEQKN